MIGIEGNGGLYKVDDDDRDDGVVDIVFYKSIVSGPLCPPGRSFEQQITTFLDFLSSLV